VSSTLRCAGASRLVPLCRLQRCQARAKPEFCRRPTWRGFQPAGSALMPSPIFVAPGGTKTNLFPPSSRDRRRVLFQRP
jgi:hypothetical protein